MKLGLQITLITLLGITSCKNNEKKEFISDNVTWIDLTYTFDSTTLYWPNNKRPYDHITDAAGFTKSGYFYSSYSICAPEHGGTHLDAPVHFAKDKQTVEQVPLTSLTGSAIVIDIADKAMKDKDYQLQIEDILAWEKIHGTIKENSIVLIRTGFGRFYPDRARYFGNATNDETALQNLHFPGIHPTTALWLVQNRKLKALGLDTPSLDYGQSKDFKTHQILLGNNIPGFENIANLDQLPETGSYVIALPMKIGEGSGAPLRIIATKPD